MGTQTTDKELSAGFWIKKALASSSLLTDDKICRRKNSRNFGSKIQRVTLSGNKAHACVVPQYKLSLKKSTVALSQRRSNADSIGLTVMTTDIPWSVSDRSYSSSRTETATWQN